MVDAESAPLGFAPRCGFLGAFDFFVVSFVRVRETSNGILFGTYMHCIRLLFFVQAS